MPTIERVIASITEDRRASYLFRTKAAAAAVGVTPNKFNDWWQRTRRKLIELYKAQPGELAAELAAMIAIAEAERQQAPPSEPTRRRIFSPPDRAGALLPRGLSTTPGAPNEATD